MHQTRRPRRAPGRVTSAHRGIGAIAAASTLALTVIAAPAAFAYPTPGPVSSNGAPARFLPAPTESAYCESVDYFGPWEKNVTLSADQNADIEPLIDKNNDGNFTNDTGTQSIINDVATTGSSGVTADFTRIQTGGNNGGSATPVIMYGSNSDLGIVMNGGAQASIALSEPMFYSQWVFTDVDGNGEGFDVSPNWATTGNDILLTSANTGMTPGGDSSTITFVKNGETAADGYMLKGRVQTDFFGAINGYTFTKVGTSNAGSGFVGGSGCLPFGVAKSASEPVYDAATGTFSVDYTIAVRNTLPDSLQLRAAIETAVINQANNGYAYRLTGLPTGINEEVMQITESLTSPGFTNVAVSNLQSTGLTTNPDFNGTTDTNLLAGSDSLAPQTTGTVTFTATYTPELEHSAWDDCSNTLSNSATATAQAQGVSISDASDNGTNPIPTSDNGGGTTDDPTPVEFDLACSLTVDKSPAFLLDDADGSTDMSAGDTVSYSVTATNSGGGQLDNVVVSDPQLVPPSKTCPSVAPGGSCILIGTATLTGAEVAAGNKTNTASASANQADLVSDTSVTPLGQPAMILAKSAGKLTTDADGSGDISAGDTLTYTLTATNTGTSNLTNVAISDPLLTMTPDPYVCAGPLAPNQTCIATGTYVVTGGDVDAGQRVNTASAVADQLATSVAASSTTPIGKPKLTLDKSAGVLTTDADGSGDISAGDTLTYTITASNTGTAALTGLTIADPGVTFATNPYECASPLEPTETCTATGTYLVTSDDVAAGFKSNTATADADQTPPVTDTSVTSLPLPKIELAKATPTLTTDADSSGDISVGDTLTYQVTATNVGAATLTDVLVADPATTPSSATCATLAPGATCVLDATSSPRATSPTAESTTPPPSPPTRPPP